MQRLLNFEYGCIHGTYWMYYGFVGSFASVFLLARGYSNSEIGLTLAVANVLAVLLQPLVADLADRAKRISVIGITEIMSLTMMAATAGLFVFQRKALALSGIFVLLIAWHTVLQPLLNSLAFRLEKAGVDINFGLTRAVGSLAYSALVAVLGTLVEKHGIMMLPVTGEVVLIMFLVSLFFTKKHYNKAKALNDESRSDESRSEKVVAKETINLLQFISNNKLFFVVNLGVIGLYFSNSVLNNYMVQIVTAVGGDSEDMGRILGVMAFLEIPTMVCFNMLRRKFSCQSMLKVAAIGFVVKIGICNAATSVMMIFVAQLFQLVSFALFLPAMVHFTNEAMRKGEAVKGQALFTMMITIATVISSLVGGVILDVSGAKVLTLVSTLITIAGAGVIIVVIDKVKQR